MRRILGLIFIVNLVTCVLKNLEETVCLQSEKKDESKQEVKEARPQGIVNG